MFFDLPQLQGAAKLAQFTEGWIADIPAVTENRVGRGRALYISTFAEPGFYADFLGHCLVEAGVRLILGEVPPAAIEVAERSAPDGRRLIFLMNSTGSPQSLQIPSPMRDIWADKAVHSPVSFAPWQVRVCC
jgi:beta-galactosidase